MIKKYQKTANMFDITATNTSKGYVTYAFLASDGTVTPAEPHYYSEWNISEYIEISPNETYTFSDGVSHVSPAVCVYDENKNYISGYSFNDSDVITFTANSQAKYVRLSIFKNTEQPQLSNPMFNKGSSALPFEPYGDTWKEVGYKRYETSTDTITTLPTELIADTVSAYTIKGNTVQNGTPTPSNPVIPNGVGERTENLLATLTQNYAIDASGNINYNVGFMYYTAYCTGNETYTFSLESGLPGNTTVRIHAFNGDTWISQLSSAAVTMAPFTVTTPNNTTNLKISITRDAISKDCMLNVGSTAKPYEPYGQFKIPISSGGVTTNIYLGSTQTVRQIGKYTFDGTENWSNQNVGQHGAVSIRKDELPLTPDMPAGTLNVLSTHFKAISNSSQLDIGEMVAGGSYLNFDYDGTNNLTDFKAFLATQYANGTPVTIWYVLATAETAAVNEPLMKIGDYADSIAGSTISTTGTAEQFDIDTPIKPSEVSLTYTGWHNKTDTKF